MLGVKDVYLHLRADIAALRESGDPPIPVRVPLCLPGLPGGVQERPMLFIPDASHGPGGAAAFGVLGGASDSSGWLVSESRWEGRLHGGARRWRS